MRRLRHLGPGLLACVGLAFVPALGVIVLITVLRRRQPAPAG
jgi:hypothetical protein